MLLPLVALDVSSLSVVDSFASGLDQGLVDRVGRDGWFFVE